MLVLFVSFSLLVGAPAIILWMGKLIARWTAPGALRKPPSIEEAPPQDGSAWYYQRMRPAFKRQDAQSDAD